MRVTELVAQYNVRTILNIIRSCRQRTSQTIHDDAPTDRPFAPLSMSVSDDFSPVTEESPLEDVLPSKLAARTLGDGTARVTAPQKTVRRIFVVTGAGGSDEYLAAARRNADALITGEVKHHIFTEASILGFPVIEVSHYDSEIMCCEVLSDMIKSEFSDLKVVKAPNSRPYKTLEEL